MWENQGRMLLAKYRPIAYTNLMQKVVLFVHGFGVKKDARGIFTDIAQALKADPSQRDFTSILFDMNEVAEGSNNIRLNSLPVQVQKLREQYAAVRKSGATSVHIISHSQGCVVTALANLPEIEKVILLAPPTNNDMEKTIHTFKNRPGTIINTDGDSVLMRKDGSTTTVPKEYWESRKELNYLELYAKLALHNRITTIIARQDEIVSNSAVNELAQFSEIITIDGDHNFTNEYRIPLINEIKKLL